MKAVLLNSGVGRRLASFTREAPKCLVSLGSKVLLEHQLDNFLKVGITDFLITTGFFEDKINNLIQQKYSNLSVTYVKSDRPEDTNYIYSLWLARKYLNDDFFLVHGDLVFDHSLLEKLFEINNVSCALVNRAVELPEKDFKARIVDGKIQEIGVNVFGQDAVFCAPLYKILKNDMQLWLKEIDQFIKNNQLTVYAENAFNNISDQLKLYPVYYTDEFCAEIDDEDDLIKVHNYFNFQKRKEHEIR